MDLSDEYEKIETYKIYHCLKVKPSIFSQKIISERKNQSLFCIYARRLPRHLWFNGRWKLHFADLNWSPCLEWVAVDKWQDPVNLQDYILKLWMLGINVTDINVT